jgi:hypothetical protein
MTDVYGRPYLRDSSSLRAVDAGLGRTRQRNGGRQQHDNNDKAARKHKRDVHKPARRDSGRARVHSTFQSGTNSYSEPQFELHVIGQPSRGIVLGVPVDTSVMVNLRFPSGGRQTNATSIDTSRLIAVASLVAEGRNGDRVPLEAGIMTGQNLFDSVHPASYEYADRLSTNDPCRLVLGYFSFPGLFIRQAGTYRIRTTLIQVSEDGNKSVVSTDSEPIKVDRRATATPRRHHRVYS